MVPGPLVEVRDGEKVWLVEYYGITLHLSWDEYHELTQLIGDGHLGKAFQRADEYMSREILDRPETPKVSC